jgi:hypothetical protein
LPARKGQLLQVVIIYPIGAIPNANVTTAVHVGIVDQWKAFCRCLSLALVTGVGNILYRSLVYGDHCSRVWEFPTVRFWTSCCGRVFLIGGAEYTGFWGTRSRAAD